MAEPTKLVSALERTLELVRASKYDGGLAGLEATKTLLTAQLEHYRQTGKFSFWGKGKLRFLFLPTNELQEISVLNGWGDEYLKIAVAVDSCLN